MTWFLPASSHCSPHPTPPTYYLPVIWVRLLDRCNKCFINLSLSATGSPADDLVSLPASSHCSPHPTPPTYYLPVIWVRLLDRCNKCFINLPLSATGSPADDLVSACFFSPLPSPTCNLPVIWVGLLDRCNKCLINLSTFSHWITSRWLGFCLLFLTLSPHPTHSPHPSPPISNYLWFG